MTSFFQRGELLAPDAVGVPADEVRGDEDEHRAHGRGQKQLIRVEVAAGIARVFGEDGRRRLERDGPDDERVDDARKHHGQHDVDDHLHALRRAGAPGGRIVARRGGASAPPAAINAFRIFQPAAFSGAFRVPFCAWLSISASRAPASPSHVCRLLHATETWVCTVPEDIR